MIRDYNDELSAKIRINGKASKMTEIGAHALMFSFFYYRDFFKIASKCEYHVDKESFFGEIAFKEYIQAYPEADICDSFEWYTEYNTEIIINGKTLKEIFENVFLVYTDWKYGFPCGDRYQAYSSNSVVYKFFEPPIVFIIKALKIAINRIEKTIWTTEQFKKDVEKEIKKMLNKQQDKIFYCIPCEIDFNNGEAIFWYNSDSNILELIK